MADKRDPIQGSRNMADKRDPIQKFFAEILTAALEEEENRLKAQAVRVKMLRQIRDSFPVLWAEINKPPAALFLERPKRKRK
jgi:hypothetical protein